MTCKISDHTWQPTPRASSPSLMLPGELVPAVCATCGTRYPCRHACDHVDCCIERGEPLPDWIVLAPDPASEASVFAERAPEGTRGSGARGSGYPDATPQTSAIDEKTS